MKSRAPTLASRSPALDRSQVYVELIKPRITFMVLLTVAIGYLCARPESPSVAGVLHVLLGTALSCSGAGALNQFFERDVDLAMDRTRFRPLPSQRVSVASAVTLGVGLALAGVLYLLRFANPLAAFLNAATVGGYLFLYTPLKRVTPVSTLVGAIPGALPPVIGWAAASGSLDAGAVVLFAILFLWQVPHFLAIGWLYRQDYARAGFPMLSVVDPSGRTTVRQMRLYALTLIPTSLMLTLSGSAGQFFFVIALAAGAGYLVATLRAAASLSDATARRVLLASVFYLPVLFGALLLERAYEALVVLL